MRITKATKKDKKETLKIAADLKEWFSAEGRKNMKIDFELNNLAVAKEKNRVLGFLCYTSYSGKIRLLWLGVRREIHGKGVGRKLLKWLENKGKKLGFSAIETETLPEEENYRPYIKTHSFYYKNGFKRILYKKARVAGWDDQVVLEKKI